MKPRLIFWYEFASTYSYLSAMRIQALAQTLGVELEWRPFLLAPIFKARGWTTSPFNIYADKGRYMVRDITRIATERGIKFSMPPAFPANGLKAARLAVAAAEDGHTPQVSQAIYLAEFEFGLDINDENVLRACLQTLDLDADALMARTSEDTIKAIVRKNTDEAQALGIFGAPSFTTADGELFWGDDRLEQALRWAAAMPPMPI